MGPRDGKDLTLEPLTNTDTRNRSAAALSRLARSSLPQPESEVTAPSLLTRSTNRLPRLMLPTPSSTPVAAKEASDWWVYEAPELKIYFGSDIASYDTAVRTGSAKLVL